MTTLPFDIMSLAAGALAGIVLGFFLFRRGTSSLETHLAEKLEIFEAQNRELLQKSAKLESELEKEAEALQQQLKLIEATKAQMSADFKAMSLEALNASRENFLAIAQEKFTQLQTTAQTDIKQTVSPLANTLKLMDEKVTALEKERHGAYGELREHLKAMKQDQDKLRLETASLVTALRSPSTRGQWGEMQLKRTLEMAGLVQGIHYDEQVAIENQRPDVVVRLPGGKNIIIDAKAPIEAYLDALKDGVTEADRVTALDRHARHVRDHIKQLGSKAYWEKFDTPEFVIMFLPGESYYSAALERDPSLLEAGVDQKVIPSSPTTLISLLKAVAYGWQQEKLAANAREISEMGAELYKRLCTFSAHLEKVGKGLNGAVENYNKAMGSYSARVIPAARDFQKLQHLTADEKLPDMVQIEATPASAPDLTVIEGDGAGDADTGAKKAYKG
ncbi:MAG TPA: DNA recombination protein RmuC [Patescibacteria group bacterium]|nr:DNA recombination protein RmuC [Patescibacteria group bacterium]